VDTKDCLLLLDVFQKQGNSTETATAVARLPVLRIATGEMGD